MKGDYNAIHRMPTQELGGHEYPHSSLPYLSGDSNSCSVSLDTKAFRFHRRIWKYQAQIQNYS